MFSHQPDCIAVTESWTNNKVCNAELNINGYDIIARADGDDTTDGRGRGIIIYAKHGVTTHVQETQPSFNQAVQFKINKTSCLVVYRSPNIGDRDPQLQQLLTDAGPWDLVLGDFNLPGINWTSNMATTSTEEDYLEIFQDCFFQQMVEFPTHTRGNVLDLILARDPSEIHDICNLKEEAISDHFPILIQLNTFSSNKAEPKPCYKYNKMNTEGLRDFLLSINWNAEFSNNSPEQMWFKFKNTVLEAMEQHVPKEAKKVTNQPMWMERTTLRCIRRKQKAYSRYKSTKQDNHFELPYSVTTH